MAKIGELIVALGADTSKLRAGMQESNRIVSNLGKAMVGLGMAMGAGIGYATKLAVDFEYAMTEVWTLMDEVNEKGFKEMSKAVLKLSTEVPQSADVLARAMYDIVSAGFRAAEAMKVLEMSAKLAVAAKTDAATAADILTSSIRAYNLSGEDATYVSDILFKTIKLGKVRMEDLVIPWGRVVKLASDAGVRIEELAAAFATLTVQGLSVEIASTALMGVMRSLIGPSDALAITWKKLTGEAVSVSVQKEGLIGVVTRLVKHLGINTEKLKEVAQAAGDDEEAFLALAEKKGMVTAELKEMFPNVRALIGFLGLASQGGEGFSKALGEVQKASGSTSKAFEKMMGTLVNQIELVKSSLYAFAISMGEQLIPYLKIGAQWVGKLADAFANLPEPAKKFIAVGGILSSLFMIIAGFALIFGSRIAMMGAMAAVAGTSIKAILIGALVMVGKILTPLIAVVAAFAGIGYLVYENWGKIKEAFAPLKPVVEGLTDVFRKIGDIITAFPTGDIWEIAAAMRRLGVPEETVQKFLDAFQKIEDRVKQFKDWFTAALKPIANAIKIVVDTATPLLKDLAVKFIELWVNIQPALQKLMDALKPLLPIFKNIGIVVLGALVIAGGAFYGLLSAVMTVIPYIVDILASLMGVVTNFAGFFYALFTGKFGLAWDYLKAMFGNLRSLVESFVVGILASVWSFIKGVIDFFVALYNAIVGGSIIADLVRGIIGWFQRLIALAQPIINLFKVIIVAVFGAIKAIVTTIVMAVKNVIVATLSLLKAIWSGGWNSIKEAALRVWGAIKSGVASIFNALFGSIVSIGSSIRSHLERWVSGIKSAVVSRFYDIKRGVISVFGYIGDKVGGWVERWRDNIMAPLKAIWKAVKAIFDKIKGAVTGALNLKKAKESPQTIYEGISRSIDAVIKEYRRLGEIGVGLPRFVAPGVETTAVAGVSEPKHIHFSLSENFIDLVDVRIDGKLLSATEKARLLMKGGYGG